jgi:hypothetical protein
MASSDEASDRRLLEEIIDEARRCGAENVVAYFEANPKQILAEIAEARRLGQQARRRNSPFVYVMQ